MGELHHSGNVRRPPLLGVGERRLAVVVFVALKVGFGFEIDAVFVAEIIEIGVVGIVRSADVIDVGTFHHHDFFLHLLAGDGVSCGRIGLVAVDAFQLQRLSVDKKIASSQLELVFAGWHIFDFNGAEADLRRDSFNHTPLLVFEFSHKHVDVRLFSRPRLNVGQLRIGLRKLSHKLVFVRIKLVFVQLVSHVVAFRTLSAEVFNGGFNVERASSLFPLGVGDEVLNVHFRRGIDADRAENAGQTEHVLRLEERAVAVAIDFHADGVVAHSHMPGDVESCGVARVFGETDVLPVNPEVEEGVNAIELDEDFLPLPRFRNVERAAVGTHFVAELVGCPEFRRLPHDAFPPVVFLHLVVEDDGLVDVDGHAVSSFPLLFLLVPFSPFDAHDVPAGGNRDLVPLGAVEVRLEEVGGTLIGVLCEVEFPCPVKRHLPTAEFGQ